MPLISVVIPTRERCETLKFALKTLCNQDFADCEFIISDNASEDDTAAVVAEFSDPRIRYIRTATRLSMTGNYNFAIEHALGTYITAIGDDDGLTPGALTALADLIRTTGTEAVSWRPAAYYWPNHPLEAKRNWLFVPIRSEAWNISARAALLAITWALVRWDRLPILYHGMVKREVLERLRTKTGMFLKSEVPDVYSAIAIATQINSFVSVDHPYSIHGFSASSAAASFQLGWDKGVVKENDNVSRFWSETTMEPPAEFSYIGLRMEGAAILESLYRVRDVCLDGRLFIPFSLWLYKLAREIRFIKEPARSQSVDRVAELAARHWREFLFRLLVKYFGKPIPDIDRPPLVSMGNLVLRGDEFALQTIEDAARLTAKIRRPPASPALRPAGLREIFQTRRVTRSWMS
jgi:glycosyltransferase involved in cell wall biosynthesis